MKLCVTSSGRELNSRVEGSFGRAPFFLIIDTTTMEMIAVANTAADAVQGAGIGAAQTMAEREVEGVLTGRIGPKASVALKSAGINIYEGISLNDTVEEAVNKFNRNEYQETSPGISDTDAAQEPCRPGMGYGRGGGQGRGGGRGMGRGQGMGRGRGMGMGKKGRV